MTLTHEMNFFFERRCFLLTTGGIGRLSWLVILFFLLICWCDEDVSCCLIESSASTNYFHEFLSFTIKKPKTHHLNHVRWSRHCSVDFHNGKILNKATRWNYERRLLSVPELVHDRLFLIRLHNNSRKKLMKFTYNNWRGCDPCMITNLLNRITIFRIKF